MPGSPRDRAGGGFRGIPRVDFDEAAAYSELRRGETIGRPIGDARWIAAIEARTGRKLARGKPGRRSGNGVTVMVSEVSP